MMKDRQNIVIIISDQQRWDSLGCNGNDFVKTPYLDEFSKEALNFKNSFTPFPVCTPARATMWTGVYPHAHGLIHNRYGIDDVINYESKIPTTVFEMLQNAGYTTAYFGKWHLGEKNSGRFDIWEGFNSHGGHWIDGKQSFQGGKYKSYEYNDLFIKFIKSPQSKKKPFVGVISYYPPHNPFTAPIEFYKPYRGKGIPFAGYYAAVSAIDYYAGNIIKAIKNERLFDDTIIFYISDHGETFNYRDSNLLNKGSIDVSLHKWLCYEESIRIPTILYVPGQTGKKILKPIGLQDLSPTILDIAGIKIPDYMHGKSLLRFLSNQTFKWRDDYYIESERRKTRTFQRSIWTNKWKLILGWDENHYLFNLNTDPEEELNIFNTPRKDKHNQFSHFQDYSNIIINLTKRMKKNAVEINDIIGLELFDKIIRQKNYFNNK